MYLISGDSVTADLPADFPHIIGSLRPAQQFLAFGQDIINVYEKGTFTGKSDYSKEDLPKFKIGEAASLVITSYNPWTVYTGEYYTGDSLCVTPYTDLNLTSNPPVPMVGYYPYISKMGVPMTIKSARHGCYSDDVVQPAPVIKLDGRTEAGGWGPIV
ncbi:hypothetical protein O3P69_018170 [Scylla paramamosain]|uniref:IgGFc-binding protein N-terminal domain-containing protein n=2 Tax=Scylla paramamosain TaxID=85552 RepID=A0AAW0TJV3_SCYPA